MSDTATALATTAPHNDIDPAETFDRLLSVSGYQKETMVEKLFELRKANNAAITMDQAEDEVDAYYSTDLILEEAHKTLSRARHSPIVSRETQTAFLKGMLLDFTNGKKRRGLGAMSALKAVELLNRMTGYDAPQEIKVKHDHVVNVFPVVGEGFTGELPPLDIIDIDSTVVLDHKPTKPKPLDEMTPEELFP